MRKRCRTSSVQVRCGTGAFAGEWNSVGVVLCDTNDRWCRQISIARGACAGGEVTKKSKDVERADELPPEVMKKSEDIELADGWLAGKHKSTDVVGLTDRGPLEIGADVF